MTKICRDNQIEKMDTLIKAVRILKDLRDYGGMERSMELLTQIQQAVISIGTVLEQDFQDYTPLVAVSEQLCELLYQISQSMDDSGCAGKLVMEAEEMMLQLKQGLCAANPRKEIAFLPYQISMWDSLESVWLAAKEDEEADSYVVPIPYYDVLPDGSLGTLHDQGSDYPDYVPVTSYENYLLEERHPDVIFFHNPYDGCNTVTRVPERYYASQLKKCTEQLVYIPYYLSPEGGPSDHLCYMPGVLFADKVIVQPDSVYDTYCRVYTQKLKENGWEKVLKPAEEKFLPLGSPKFDKLRSMSCRMEDLPKSWKKIILKPDGSKKKIVLYNLTIIGLLNNNEWVLKKIDQVFQAFKEKQDEVVLLWRPHPLLLTTIDAMRPYLRGEYRKRVQQFKEERWGIFDETPDANLAIAMSNAYYGDWSSLVVAYEATKKTLVLQNVRGTEEKDFLIEILKEDADPKNRESSSTGDKGGVKRIGNLVYHIVAANLQ